MTVIGANCLNWDEAIIWADSETYLGRTAIAERSKLVISPLAGVVGAGRGLVSVTDTGRLAVLDALDFDDLANTLPAKLLQAAAETTKRKGARPSDLTETIFLVAGFSKSAGRMLVQVFEPERLYEPRIAPRAAFPDVGAQGGGRASTFSTIIPVARQQMAFMREGLPQAAGTLCAAHTSPSLKLDETWLIASVTYIRDTQGTRADVTLMPPTAFIPQPAVPYTFDNEVTAAATAATGAQTPAK